MANIKPFSDDAASIPIGELTVENSPDRLTIYGSLNIPRDKAGLQLAQELKQLLEATIATLQADRNLPDQIPIAPAERVDNPFK